MKGKRIDIETEQLICKLYLDGEYYKDICKEVPISLGSIYNILKRNKIKTGRPPNQTNNLIKYCRKCNIELDDNNWASYRKQKYECICNKCMREYQRYRGIDTCDSSGNRVYYVCEKRKFNNECEMCGKPLEKNPRYHHWNDDKPELGIWVCAHCHFKCEIIEDTEFYLFKEKYLELKNKINEVNK